MVHAPEAQLGTQFAEHQRFLKGVCYRMVGSVADAEDLVQETFLRAMERPPSRTHEPLRPWLLKVAMNLSRDALRKRRRRSYVGTWLPAPVPEEEVIAFEIAGEGGTEGRYDLMESVSIAFLLALEVLTPNQRAILLLRDVLDFSVNEAAETLGMTEANVKVLHHRARRALSPYEATRDDSRPTPKLAKIVEETLRKLMTALATGDEPALTQLFRSDVEAWSDGGGEFLASRKIIAGSVRVARMYLGLAKKTSPVQRIAFRSLNGLPAIVAERSAHRGEAPLFVMACDVDGAGLITRVYSVLATPKLKGVAPIG